MFRNLYSEIVENGLELLRRMIPSLAGKLTLHHFTALALALGAINDLPPEKDEDLAAIILEEKGNISAAARRLHRCPKTIYRRLKAAGIQPGILRGQQVEIRHQPP